MRSGSNLQNLETRCSLNSTGGKFNYVKRIPLTRVTN
jgi:hypothetical protein